MNSQSQVAVPSEIDLRAWTKKLREGTRKNDLAESTDIEHCEKVLAEGTRNNNWIASATRHCDNKVADFDLKSQRSLQRQFFFPVSDTCSNEVKSSNPKLN